MQELPFDSERLAEVCKENDVAMLGALEDLTDWDDDEGDLDLYVRFVKTKNMVAAITLGRMLRGVFGRPVELLTEESLTPHMRKRVLADIQILYAS